MNVVQERYEIDDGIYIIDLCLYIDEHDVLVVGDAHLGYEESLAKQGVLIPKFQFKEIKERMEEIIELTNPSKVIIVGDLKHEFGTISEEEWRDTLEFIDMLQEKGELVLIKGNHDTILKPIAEKRNVDIRETYRLGKYYFCHGHEIPEDLELEKSEVIVIGHEHPALGLKDGARVETYKCFLKGRYRDSQVIVLPSLSSLPEGTDVTKEEVQSPFLKNISQFEAFVVEDTVYEFGKLEKMMNQE